MFPSDIRQVGEIGIFQISVGFVGEMKETVDIVLCHYADGDGHVDNLLLNW